MSEALPFHEPNPSQEEEFTLNTIHSEQNRVLRESGIADKAMSALERSRELYEERVRNQGGTPLPDISPDLSNPTVIAAVSIVKRKYQMGEDTGSVVLEQPTVVLINTSYDDDGSVKRDVWPVTVAKVYEGVAGVSARFDESDYKVVSDLIEGVKLAQEHGIIPNLSPDLLTISEPEVVNP
ncbi:MAG: hypothetical protein JWO35_519 [Candidatus Saccharibacteria bacterium]|nr:hypothetical protein [Candidatus Saccharibacteria bacterium]